jgi:hypothetical protein
MNCFGGCVKNLENQLKDQVETMFPVIEAKVVSIVEQRLIPLIEEQIKKALEQKSVNLSEIVTEVKETVAEEIKE